MTETSADFESFQKTLQEQDILKEGGELVEVTPLELGEILDRVKGGIVGLISSEAFLQIKTTDTGYMIQQTLMSNGNVITLPSTKLPITEGLRIVRNPGDNYNIAA